MYMEGDDGACCVHGTRHGAASQPRHAESTQLDEYGASLEVKCAEEPCSLLSHGPAPASAHGRASVVDDSPLSLAPYTTSRERSHSSMLTRQHPGEPHGAPRVAESPANGDTTLSRQVTAGAFKDGATSEACNSTAACLASSRENTAAGSSSQRTFLHSIKHLPSESQALLSPLWLGMLPAAPKDSSTSPCRHDQASRVQDDSQLTGQTQGPVDTQPHPPVLTSAAAASHSIPELPQQQPVSLPPNACTNDRDILYAVWREDPGLHNTQINSDSLPLSDPGSVDRAPSLTEGGQGGLPVSWRITIQSFKVTRSQVQSWVHAVTSHEDFQFFVVMLIFLNCVTLALYQPAQPRSRVNNMVDEAGIAFNVVFTVELILRVIAKGSLIKYAQNPWNFFDLIMVLAGYTSIIPSAASNEGAQAVKALRALRALAPLRTITHFQSFRAIVVCFFEAIPMLASVVVLLAFVIFVVAVVGVSIFKDAYHYACYNSTEGFEPAPYAHYESSPVFTSMGCGYRKCPPSYTCQEFHKLDVDAWGFDNVAVGMLTIFSCITLSNWSSVAYRMVDRHGPATIIYFVLLTLFGSCVLLNLFLAVLKTKFATAQSLVFGVSHGSAPMTSSFGVVCTVRKAFAAYAAWLEHSKQEKLRGQQMWRTQLEEIRKQKHATNQAGGSAAFSHYLQSPSDQLHTSGTPAAALDLPEDAAGGLQNGSKAEEVHSEDLSPTPGRFYDDQPYTSTLRPSHDTLNLAAMLPAMHELAAQRMQGDGAMLLPGSESGHAGMPAPTLSNRPSSDGPPASSVGKKFHRLPSRIAVHGKDVKRQWIMPPSLLTLPSINASRQPLPALQAYNGMMPLMPPMMDPAASSKQYLPRPVGEGTVGEGADLLAGLRVAGQEHMPSIRITPGRGSSANKTDVQPLPWSAHQPSCAGLPHSFHAVVPVSECMVCSSSTRQALTECTPRSDRMGESLSECIACSYQIGPSLSECIEYADTIWPSLSECIEYADTIGPSLPDSITCTDRVGQSLPACIACSNRMGQSLSECMECLNKRGQFSAECRATPGRIGHHSSGWTESSIRAAQPLSESLENADSSLVKRVLSTTNWGSPAGKRDTASSAAQLTDLPSKNAGAGSSAPKNLNPAANDNDLVTPAGAAASRSVAQPVLDTQLSLQEMDEVLQSYPPMTRRRLMVMYRIRVMVQHPLYDNVFLCCTIINMMLLAMEYDGISSEMERALSCGNQVMTWCFCVEIVLKMLGLGPFEYCSDRFNLFDLVVVLLSVVEVVMSSGSALVALRSVRSLRVLKSLRVLRLFKMFRYLRSLRTIGTVLISSMSSFFAIAMLIALFLIVLSVVGLHIYGMYQLSTGDFPNFRNFFNSLIINFQVLTLENWDAYMYSTAAAAGFSAIPYFLSWVILGKYILLALFLAVMMQAFESKFDPDDHHLNGMHRALNKRKRLAKHLKSATNGDQETEDADKENRQRLMSLTNRNGRASASMEQTSAWKKNSAAHKTTSIWAGVFKTQASSSQNSSLQTQTTQIPVQLGKRAGQQMQWKVSNASFKRQQSKNFNDVGRLNHFLLAPVDPHSTSILTNYVLDAKGARTDAAKAIGSNARFSQPIGEGSEPTGKMSGHGLRDQAVGGIKKFGYNIRRSLDFSGTLPASRGSYTDPHAAPGSSAAAQSQVNMELDAKHGNIHPSPATGWTRPHFPTLTSWPHFRISLKRTSCSKDPDAAASMEVQKFNESKYWRQSWLDQIGFGTNSAPLSSLHRHSNASITYNVTLGSGPPPLLQTPEVTMNKLKPRFADMILRLNMSDQAMQAKLSMLLKNEEAGNAHDSTSLSSADDLSSFTDADFDPIFSDEGDKAMADYSQQLHSKTCGCLSDQSWLRRTAFKVVKHPYFEWFMNLIMLASCVGMAFESYDTDDKSVLHRSFYLLDIITTCIFGVEMLLSVMAYTFRGYIMVRSNQLEFLILVMSVVVVFVEATNVQALKALRILRTVRPLRALNRSSAMQLVLRSITNATAAVTNVFIICMLFFIMFAILGVQLFSGRFRYCNDAHMANKAQCVGMYTNEVSGALEKREWQNKEYNFDNIFNALVSLFIVASLNGYTDIMVSAMSMPTNKDDQPRTMGSPLTFFFFLGFITVCAFILLNMAAGVVYFQFTRIRLSSENGSAFLTTDQQRWTTLARNVFSIQPVMKPRVPTNRCHRMLFQVVNHTVFDFAILAVIMANVFLMATTHYGEPSGLQVVKEKLEYAFSSIFMSEAAMKIIGFGWTYYWSNYWNKFDLLLAFLALLDILVTTLSKGVLPLLRTLRVQKFVRLLRISRVIKLARPLKGLQTLIATMTSYMPAFANIGSLLFLVVFIYAYTGVITFGKVAQLGDLNNHANFKDFAHAMLTLYRVTTGDDWSSIMVGCALQPPQCSRAAGNCGNPILAFFYFTSFVAMANMILLNLFTAIMIETFERQQDQEEWVVSPAVFENFVHLWGEYDDGSHYISPQDFQTMLQILRPPLGLGPGARGAEVVSFCGRLNLKLLGGAVGFHGALYALVHRCGLLLASDNVDSYMDKIAGRRLQSRKSDEVDFGTAVAATRTQRLYRAYQGAVRVRGRLQVRGRRGSNAVALEQVVSSSEAWMGLHSMLGDSLPTQWVLNPECTSCFGAAGQGAQGYDCKF